MVVPFLTVGVVAIHPTQIPVLWQFWTSVHVEDVRQPTNGAGFAARDHDLRYRPRPLVAYLNRHDPYHRWAVSLMKQARPPLRTCEPVLTETMYFLREDGVDVTRCSNC